MNPTRINPAVIFVACVVVALLVGLIEFLSGDEFELYIFYLIPIGAAAWLAGRRAAMVMAGLSIVVALMADVAAGFFHANRFSEIWGFLLQAGVLWLVAWLATLDKEMLDRERHLNHELKQALAHVRQLSGLLPICVSCKKVRNDKGYWESVESYLETHSMAQVGQGLCPDCMQNRLGQS